MSILKKAFDNLSSKPFVLDEKSEKILNDETQPLSKRFKILAKFVENGDPEVLKPYFVEKYAAIYKIFLDSLQQFDQEMKLKNNPNKFIPTSEVISLTHIMLGLFKYAHAIIQKKWQQRSLVHHIECFLTPDNVFNVRLEGFELLLNFVDIMQENTDEKVLDLIMAVLDLKLFADPKVKLPGFPYRVIDEKDRVKIQKTDKVITDQEQIVMITRFFTFIRQGDGTSFNFWWKFFKTRLATLLYPHECQSLELLNKLDDMGFRQPYTCPHSIHLLVLNLILDSLEMKKKADVIYASDKDIYLMLLIFRQSFLLPPQYFEYILKMLKPYHAWICGDQQQQSSMSVYSWPEIMEKSRNIYYRVFIDNLMQAFFMKGEESYMDVHLLVVYEVLDIFMFFVQISGKLEMQTWSALLLAHVDIYQHVVIRKTSTSGDFKYDNEFGAMLIGIITRNLFILWVKAHLDEDELWVQLGDIVRDHDQVQCQYVYDFWYNTIINLSKCLLMRIFKCPDELVGPYPTYDVEKFIIEKKKGKTTKTSKKIGASIKDYLRNLDLDVVLYLFHKMLSLIGVDNTGANGKTYAKKLKVIHDVFNLFQQISHQEVKLMKGSAAVPFIHAPEGNNMIELMGYWLFDASERNDSAFVEGRLYAYKVLCKTFQTKFSQPWNKVYLGNFLRVIHNGLSKGTNDIRDVIFIHSTEFFGLQLPGSNLLVPDFVKAAEQIYKSPKTSKEVKYAAISIMTAILSLCYFFGDVELPNIDTVQFEDELGDGKQSEDNKGASSSVDVSYHNFLQIKDRISKLLLSATSDEAHEECQIHAMWGIFQLLFRELNPANPKVSEVRSHVDVIISCVLHKHSQLALTSHDVISSLSRHKLLASIGYIVTNKLLSSISSAIIAHITDGQNLRAEILVSLYNTMADYIINAPNETITNPTVLDDVFTAIALGLNKDKISKALPKSDSNLRSQKDGGSSKYADPSKDIYDSAYCLLHFILNYLNNFPNEIGPTTCSSHLSEYEFLREKNGYYIPNPNVLHYAFNGTTLFTIVEKVKSTRFIVRDMAGKNVWDFHLVFRPEEATFRFPDGKKKKKLQQDEEEETIRERSGTFMLMKKLEIISDESKSKDTVADGGDGTNTSLPSGNAVLAAVDEPLIDEDATTTTTTTAAAANGQDATDANDKLQQDIQPTSEVTTEDITKAGVIMGVVDTDKVDEAEEYPIFNKDIDTDLTDMFKCLVEYSSDIFPECINFRKGAVVSLEQQNIDLKDVTEKIEAQSDTEKKILSENPIRKMVKLMHPTINTTEALAFKSFRNFMNTMGFCRQGIQINFLRLHPDWRFYKQLSILDKMSERETYKIGIIYVANGQEQAIEIFKTDQSSPLFKEFLEAIGWRIDLKSHYGYLGGLVAKECGFDTAPYYSDATIEVLFHVAPELVPKQKDPQNVFRRRIIGNDNVHIIWSEHDRDYRPWTVNSQCNYYHIVIYPLKNGLYRVQTFTKDLPSIGPLSPGIILDKTSLGPMVRATAINACRRVQVKLYGHKKAFMHRKAFVDDIISKYRSQKVEDYKDFLKPLFCQGTGTESEDVPDEPLEDPSLNLAKDKEEEYDPENEGSGKVLLKSETSSSHLADGLEIQEF